MAPLILIAGFGSFEGVERNASGEVARALASAPPAGIEVSARVLPVSFDRSPAAWDELLAAHSKARPSVLLGLGVQPAATFRLEARARGRLPGRGRPDVDGVVAAAARARVRELLSTPFDLEALAEALRGAGARPEEVTISRNAGGYVCERSYHHLLRRASERGIPGLFVHLPPAEKVEVERQARIVAALLPRLVTPA